MASLVVYPLVVIPAVVGYYYGVYDEQLRRQEKEQAEADAATTSTASTKRIRKVSSSTHPPMEKSVEATLERGVRSDLSAVASVASEFFDPPQPLAQSREATNEASTSAANNNKNNNEQREQEDELTVFDDLSHDVDFVTTRAAAEFSKISSGATLELRKISTAARTASDACGHQMAAAAEGAADELRRVELAAFAKLDACGALGPCCAAVEPEEVVNINDGEAKFNEDDPDTGIQNDVPAIPRVDECTISTSSAPRMAPPVFPKTQSLRDIELTQETLASETLCEF